MPQKPPLRHSRESGNPSISTHTPSEMIRPWQRKLYDRGWIVTNWPKRYGGMEATLKQQLILQEEFGRAGAPVLSRQAEGTSARPCHGGRRESYRYGSRWRHRRMPSFLEKGLG